VAQAVEVLLVEHRSTDAEPCSRTLRKRGLANDIRWVKDGAEALEFMFGAEFDKPAQPLPRLILLDVHLPKVSGHEVPARIIGGDLSCHSEYRVGSTCILTLRNGGRS
jgi:two-component system, response regulator